MTDESVASPALDTDFLLAQYRNMWIARALFELYEENRFFTAKYVHATSRGHEAIQWAAGSQLQPCDYVAPYYRDDSILLALGMSPYELMLQLMAKADDPFSGGRTYYSHPSLRRAGFPTIPHQSSATGMQAIPATGVAHGLKYLESQGLLKGADKPVVLCSLGDGSVTEGEVAEAFQMAILKKLPIIYLVQDNGWSISAHKEEFRAMTAYEYAAGFPGMERLQVDGTHLSACWETMQQAFQIARTERRPVLVHAPVPLIGHHTSGVRREWYREADNMSAHLEADPIERLNQELLESGVSTETLKKLEEEAKALVLEQFERAKAAPDPDPATVEEHDYAPTPIISEQGQRSPVGAEKVIMVDAALHAIDEILARHPEALFYGQDVGRRLGGVFREAALLAAKYGDERVFNTPIQEAYIVGSTAGMSAAGAKPIVEIQFADYFWTGINQLVVELSKSCYLSRGQFPVSAVIRVPIGAYGGGGPYHSGSIESTLLTIRGIKIAYPSTAADMKGLLKAAYYDPNPVIMLEHKGLYWSKVPGTDDAKTPEPDADYILPLGKARIAYPAEEEAVNNGQSVGVITYGMGVYWAKAARENWPGQVEVLDLRSLHPLDWEAIETLVKRHNRVLILTEEPLLNSFAESLAGRIASQLFAYLDAPVKLVGAKNLPAIALNVDLEKAMLPNPEKVAEALQELLDY